MLHQCHLGDEVCSLDHLALGVPPGDHDMQVGPPCLQGLDHLGERQIIVAKCNVDLVEHDKLEVGILHQLLRRLPSLRRRGHVAGFVLRLPGEAFAKGVPAHHVAEALEHASFAGVPCALDELHHGALAAIADHAQHEAESRGRFALASPGMDDEQALLGDFLGRDLCVLRRLAICHLVAMALLLVQFNVFGHGNAFRDMASPATM